MHVGSRPPEEGGQRMTGVVLAAGAGSRLGLGPKALLRSGNSFLVDRIVSVLFAGGCSDVVAVLGAGAGDVLAQTALAGRAGCRTLVNPNWQEGMGSSFRLGMEAAAGAPKILVALVDQPGLTSAAVRRLSGSHRDGRVAAAGYAGPAGALVRSHPVLFDATLAAQAAAAATGDAGARSWLRTHSHLLDVIDCSDLGHGRDIDTAADLWLLADGLPAPRNGARN